MSVSIYLATYMTGRTGWELWHELITLRNIYEKHGITVISPVEQENIPCTDEVIQDRSDEEATLIWTKKDKNQIRQANLFVYPWKVRSSQGVTKEYCLARGVLWKPCIGVYRKVRPGFITRKEDDLVCTSHEEAALVIKARWGTWAKRFFWRIKMLNRSLPKFVWDQLKEFF